MKYRLIQIKLIWMYFKVFQTDVQSPLPLIFKFVHALDKGKLKEIYRRFKKTKVASKVLNSQDHFLDIIEDGDFEPGTFGAEFKAWSNELCVAMSCRISAWWSPRPTSTAAAPWPAN